MGRFRTTIVAFYTEARPVVLRTTDPEVVHNILDELPMEYAFPAGPTNLIAGIQEAVTIPALELERLRTRQVLFFLDAVAQYVDDQPELRGLPLAHDLPEIAKEFGIAKDDAFAAVRMALTGSHDGPPLALLFPLLGHDRIMIRIGAVSSHILHGRGLEPIKYGPGGVPFATIPAAPPQQATGDGAEVL